MPQFSEAEYQVLVIVHRATMRKLPTTLTGLRSLGMDKIGDALENWDMAIERLTRDGLLEHKDGSYALTVSGQKAAEETSTSHPIPRYFYNEYYRRAEHSAAHGEFCRRVYGADLCQHGMASMSQVQVMVDLLRLTANDTVIETGCGNGMITEYISDQTGAHVTGVDIADGAIAGARLRTADKNRRLSFAIANLNGLDFPPGSFDVYVCIDSLYFVRDLETAIDQAVAMVKPEGRMALFWEAWTADECRQLPDILHKRHLSFTTHDFSEEARQHWQKKREVLEELRSRFADEDNMFLFNNRMDEVNGIAGAELIDRKLYFVTP
ncbi:MAG: class I SAM-dependent methyltransferase [candidate division Zixibacteria bacterium]|nr:class I SAM-dependent methyltransferase [candidate division Zixibacteria bacterium]